MKRITHRLISGFALLSLSACTPPPPVATTASPQPAVSSTPAEKPASKPEKPKPKPTPAALTEIDLNHFFVLREQGMVRVYDVRRTFFYRLGHIQGAISLPLKPFDQIFAREQAAMQQALREGKVIIVYCDGPSCPDAHTIGGMIAERGIPVTIYRGGWDEWKEAGME